MSYAWITDIHLDSVNEPTYLKWIEEVNKTENTGIFLTGDIAEAQSVIRALERLHKDLKAPIYFVLGNHDFYGSDIQKIKNAVAGLPYKYLSAFDVIHLTPQTALIGHDGWADGRAGDYVNSRMLLRDYFEINDFIGLSKDQRLVVMQRLADESIAKIEKDLRKALKTHQEVILLTHVPPFHASSLYENKVATPDAAPHFVSQNLGEILLKVMSEHPNHKLLVLCGHSHHGADYSPLPNLRVLVGWAEYGAPIVQRHFKVN